MKQIQGLSRLFNDRLANKFGDNQLTPLIVVILALPLISSTQASDLSQLTQSSRTESHRAHHSTKKPLPSLAIGSVLDNQGNPITLPTPQSALEYSADEMQLDRSESVQLSSNKASIKKASKSANTAATMTVANDPSCRWLASRITYLKRHIKQQQAEYHQTELGHRQKEWDCMNCATSGPTQAQHSSCQYKR
ncbi:hypothetical protein [uncultured Shewanella sp.]|uniref:hypothetical protein n=1 Tax=uncultured Shewanella sp. TaxID=173975 RepID=UPI0026256A41|nr:hypothetical protein [uncultured Shewanella sp.]